MCGPLISTSPVPPALHEKWNFLILCWCFHFTCMGGLAELLFWTFLHHSSTLAQRCRSVASSIWKIKNRYWKKMEELKVTKVSLLLYGFESECKRKFLHRIMSTEGIAQVEFLLLCLHPACVACDRAEIVVIMTKYFLNTKQDKPVLTAVFISSTYIFICKVMRKVVLLYKTGLPQEHPSAFRVEVSHWLILLVLETVQRQIRDKVTTKKHSRNLQRTTAL